MTVKIQGRQTVDRKTQIKMQNKENDKGYLKTG